MKKIALLLIVVCFCPILTTGCKKAGIVTSTGGLGHRADSYKMNSDATNKPTVKSGVIYLGKEYDNSSFGPGKVKFVFD